jgi:hypothetical protein
MADFAWISMACSRDMLMPRFLLRLSSAVKKSENRQWAKYLTNS